MRKTHKYSDTKERQSCDNALGDWGHASTMRWIAGHHGMRREAQDRSSLRPTEENNPADSLSSAFQPPSRDLEKILLLLETPGLWYFAMTVLGNQQFLIYR